MTVLTITPLECDKVAGNHCMVFYLVKLVGIGSFRKTNQKTDDKGSCWFMASFGKRCLGQPSKCQFHMSSVFSLFFFFFFFLRKLMSQRFKAFYKYRDLTYYLKLYGCVQERTKVPERMCKLRTIRTRTTWLPRTQI